MKIDRYWLLSFRASADYWPSRPKPGAEAGTITTTTHTPQASSSRATAHANERTNCPSDSPTPVRTNELTPAAPRQSAGWFVRSQLVGAWAIAGRTLPISAFATRIGGGYNRLFPAQPRNRAMAADLNTVIKQLTESSIIAQGKLENFVPPKAASTRRR